ncbi:MAG: hypothetical protein KDK62_06580 [Chlamydiia bacterium]|nr:hypothetical protein [Chlamydiia bacterium]
MKISYSPYKLRGIEGAILKVQEREHCGYSDIFPLPQLGDPPLKSLLADQKALLWKRSLHFALLDMEAQKMGESISIKLPRCHQLIDSMTQVPTQSISKVKVGICCDSEINWLKKHFSSSKTKLRLDFNLRLSRDSFLSYLEAIKSVLPQIEFIEDPYPFNPGLWEADQDKYHVPFALDYASEKGIGLNNAAPVLILKPLRQEDEPFLSAVTGGQKVIVTSCRDHEIGQWLAAFSAARFPEHITGIFSEGTPQQIPEGLGFGFEKLVQGLRWYSC